MATSQKLNDRYELREILGRGGMGVVYKALDTLMKREVALKTLIDVDNQGAIDLFYKEWGVQAGIVHPNIVGIYDIGEFDESGQKKPYFVMPLLKGATLDQLIANASARLTPERAIDIMCQALRGLQSAHEHGLVHRDLKPSNLFVMEDDSVKVIDFGVAHLSDSSSKTTLKGTLAYMAPEQLELKPPTALSDIYSMAVCAYEALTRRRPFVGRDEATLTTAILTAQAAPVMDLNNQVSLGLSQIINKGLAKQPWHRFSSAKEFADALQKGLRNESVEYFDVSKFKPRLEKAQAAYDSGDYQFATELLAELEGEGYLEPEIVMLRRRLDHSIRSQKVQKLLGSARRYHEAEEHDLALRKVQEALELEPEDSGALSLKSSVEGTRRESQITQWMGLAERHVESQRFEQAREAVKNVLKIRPNDTSALKMQSEVDRRERESHHLREEKGRKYQDAMKAWEKGEVTSALGQLESLLAMEKSRPTGDGSESATVQKFYNQVRSERDSINTAYEKARGYLTENKFADAVQICDQYLGKYPNHALFRALKFDVEERERQFRSNYIADIDKKVEAEPDLERRTAILNEALKRYPGDEHFERALRTVQDKRDLVSSIVQKARMFEENSDLAGALDQWRILQSIHEQYPGLDFEIERLTKDREEQLGEEAKERWVVQINEQLQAGDYAAAANSAKLAQDEYPADAQITELVRNAEHRRERHEQAMELLSRGQALADEGNPAEALGLVREARELDEKDTVVRKVYANMLATQARTESEEKPEDAERRLDELAEIEPDHLAIPSLRTKIAERRSDDSVAWFLQQAEHMRGDDDLDGAMAIVEQGLAMHPDERRLIQLQNLLRQTSSTGSGSSQDLGRSIHASPVMDAADDDSTPEVTMFVGRNAPPAKPPHEPPAPPAEPASPAASAEPDDEEQYLDEDNMGESRGTWRIDPNLASQWTPGEPAPTPLPRAGDAAPPPSDEPSEGSPTEILWQQLKSQAKTEDPPQQQPEAEQTPTPAPSPVMPPSSGYSGSGDIASRADFEQPGEATQLFGSLGSAPPTPPVDASGADSGAGGTPPPSEPPSAGEGSGEHTPAPAPAEAPAYQPPGTGTVHPGAQGAPAAPKKKSLLPLILAGAAAMLFLAIGLGYLIWTFLIPSEPAVVQFPIEIQAEPAGVALSVEGESCPSPCTRELPPGSYQVQASMDGFEPMTRTFQVIEIAPGPEGAYPPQRMRLALVPLEPRLFVEARLEAGTIQLDGETIGDVEDGEVDISMANLAAGEHELAIVNGRARATIRFESSDSDAPVLLGDPEVRDLKAMVVSGKGGQAILRASKRSSAAAQLDQQPRGDISAEGLTLASLSSGMHEIAVGPDDELQRAQFEAAAFPYMAVFVDSDVAVGYLTLTVNEGGATVFLNGREQRSKTRDGRRYLRGLRPGEYTVKVSKDGFFDVEAQTVSLERGATANLTFDLKPKPQVATLRIEGAPPEAEVLLNGEVIGTTDRRGAFERGGFDPGSHRIGVRKADYKGKEVRETLTAGQTTTVDGSLVQALGTVVVTLKPDGVTAQMTITKAGESSARTVEGGRVSVGAGTYTLKAVADGYYPNEATFRLAVDEVKQQEITLVEIPPDTSPKLVIDLNAWVARGWTKSGDALVRKGPDNGPEFSLAPTQVTEGTYTFEVAEPGDRRIDWVVNYSDAQNYVLYQLERRNLRRVEKVGNSDENANRVSVSLDREQFNAFRVKVADGSIQVALLVNGQWRILDQYTPINKKPGRFGFRLNGSKDEYQLKSFTFYTLPGEQ